MLRLESGPLASELSRLYPGFFSTSRGIPCRWRLGEGQGYETVFDGARLSIRASGLDNLVLSLGDLLTAGKPFSGRKVPPFDFRGIMLDASRNAVPRPDFLKDRIARLALMGLNRFCLYTEDTYTVPGEPLFGYARGRYTTAELRELSRYGRLFGVTLFPCIQTLGHMEHVLKYPHYLPLKNNEFVYNVRAKGLYDFIAKTLDAARAPYGTDLIHVGMDETFGLGRGLAFREGEPIFPRKLYVDHVRKVAALCRRKGLNPVMWGDIVLGTSRERGLSGDLARRLPHGMAMNHWDYDGNDAKAYGRDIAAFRKMGYDPILSPGVWSWSRFFPPFKFAQANIGSMLEAGRRAGVRRALNTHWGDDGHECLFDYNLPAHAYFLAACTEVKGPTAAAKAKFPALFGEDFDAVAGLEDIETGGYRAPTMQPPNVGKCFLYDDPAQGLFSGLPFVRPAGPYYRKLAARFEGRARSRRDAIFAPRFALASAFCDLLAVKADLRRRASAAYRKSDRKGLKAVAADAREASGKLAIFQRRYRNLWLEERSPFGLELVEGRMGAVSARLDYFRKLLADHARGLRPRLEELEFRHYSQFHDSRSPDYRPSVWPKLYLQHSVLASRNTIRWW